jgi:hypothetical protein
MSRAASHVSWTRFEFLPHWPTFVRFSWVRAWQRGHESTLLLASEFINNLSYPVPGYITSSVHIASLVTWMNEKRNLHRAGWDIDFDYTSNSEGNWILQWSPRDLLSLTRQMSGHVLKQITIASAFCYPTVSPNAIVVRTPSLYSGSIDVFCFFYPLGKLSGFFRQLGQNRFLPHISSLLFPNHISN